MDDPSRIPGAYLGTEKSCVLGNLIIYDDAQHPYYAMICRASNHGIK